jgi:hypothetical protein
MRLEGWKKRRKVRKVRQRMKKENGDTCRRREEWWSWITRQ